MSPKPSWKCRMLSFFPTHLIEDSFLVKRLWRLLLALLKPQEPFLFRSKYYKLFVNPHPLFLTRRVMRQGTWEPFSTALYLKELKTAQTVLDIGANFGHYALIAANTPPKKRLIIAFEPEPETRAILQDNIRLTPDSTIIVSEVALGETCGEKNLFVDGKNLGGHSFSKENIKGVKKKALVRVETLDGFLERTFPGTKIDLIKMDVQGAESSILKGAMKTISRDHPTIFCEFWPRGIQNMGKDPSEFIAFFLKNKYEIFVVDKKRNRLLKCTGSEYTQWPLFDQMEDYEVDTLIKVPGK